MAKPKKKKLKVKSMELLKAQRELCLAARKYMVGTTDTSEIEWALSEEELYACARAYARLAELADK
jgi:hypothetical protein